MRAPASENQQYAKPKTQISYAVAAQLISTVVFVTRILQFLSYLNPKFKDNPASVAVLSGVYQTWSETPIVGFLMQSGSFQSSSSFHEALKLDRISHQNTTNK